MPSSACLSDSSRRPACPTSTPVLCTRARPVQPLGHRLARRPAGTDLPEAPAQRRREPRSAYRSHAGGAALEVLDGDAGMGFVVGRAAMRRAIELARRYNVSAVGVTNSNHFGAAGLYARMAAEQGLIAIVMTNVGPNLVAPGGSRPVTGNNPIAIACRPLGLPLHAGHLAVQRSRRQAAAGQQEGREDSAGLGHRQARASHRRSQRGVRRLPPAAGRTQGTGPS